MLISDSIPEEQQTKQPFALLHPCLLLRYLLEAAVEHEYSHPLPSPFSQELPLPPGKFNTSDKQTMSRIHMRLSIPIVH